MRILATLSLLFLLSASPSALLSQPPPEEASSSASPGAIQEQPALGSGATAPAEPSGNRGEAALEFAVAKLLADEGSFREALEAFESAVNLVPEDAYVRAEYGEFLARLAQLSRSPRYRKQQLDKAIEQSERARALAPDDIDVLKVVGEAYLAAAELDPRTVEPLEKAVEVFERVRASSEYELQARMTLGQIFSYLGRDSDAESVYREVVAIRPRDRRAYDRLVETLLRDGKSAEAEVAYAEILVFDPEANDLRLELAKLQGQRGDHAAAEKTLRQGGATFLDSPPARQLLAVQLYLGGQYEDALERLDGAVEVSETKSLEPLRALILAALGRNSEAAVELRGLLAQEPENLDVASTLSRVLVRLDRRQEAAQTLGQVVERVEAGKDPDRAMALRFEWAEVLMGGEEYSEALSVLDPLLGSSNPAARNGAVLVQGEALTLLGRPEEALRLLEELAPGEVSSTAKRAQILFGMGRDEEARALLEPLWGQGDESSALAAAAVYQQLERYEEAAEVLREYISRRGEAPRVLFLLGAASERSGNHSEAERSFRRLLELTPESPDALNYLGYMWADQGENLVEALDFIQRAVSADPDNGAYVDSLGWVFHQLGRHEEALVQLERASSLVPEDGTILEHLGDVYLSLGRRGEAKQAYERALLLSDANVEQIRAKLKPLAEVATNAP
ncbi:MAG: tetratricopeptide repeat protein [Deltaproteobacteria bacterium]|nr:tetratricopeptide repeat protein [Deltaproteobacteria bacterium]